MLIAHPAAGYLATKGALALGLGRGRGLSDRTLLAVGVAASVLPDADLLYFYTIDRQQHLHYGYWTHIPAFWAVVLGLAAGVCWVRHIRNGAPVIALVALNLFLHFVLDTVAGGMRWLYPFSSRGFALVRVPAEHGHWFLNFIWHWTFILELLLWAAALYVLARSWRRRKRAAVPLGSSEAATQERGTAE